MVYDPPLLTEKYGITRSSMLVNGKLARESGGVLANMAVYVGAGIAGRKNDAPEMIDIKQLVKLAGGKVATTQAQAFAFDPSKLLIITKEVVLPTKLAAAEGAKQITLGSLLKVFSHQSLDPIQGGPNCPEPNTAQPSGDPKP